MEQELMNINLMQSVGTRILADEPGLVLQHIENKGKTWIKY
jgi:hypothetical protein